MRKSNVALRLQPSLFEEAKRVAEAEGVALNQLINVAVAEKAFRAPNRRVFSSTSRAWRRGQSEADFEADWDAESRRSRVTRSRERISQSHL